MTSQDKFHSPSKEKAVHSCINQRSRAGRRLASLGVGIVVLFTTLTCSLGAGGSSAPNFIAPSSKDAAPMSTVTPIPPTPEDPPPTIAISPSPSPPAITPTPLPPILYRTQAGDTLPVISIRFEVQPSEITSPEPLAATALLPPNQLLIIPNRLANTTSPQRLMPDSEVVFSPSAIDFDIAAFVKEAGGKLDTYQEWLGSTQWTSGAEIVARVALENSINPRLLLSLLEYQSGWVYGQPKNLAQDEYPMGLIDLPNKGLYRQLVWAMKQLSIGYYGWREGLLTQIQFTDGVTTRLSPDLNAGTVALQYFFAQLYDSQGWLQTLDKNQGLPALHERMFGSPWVRAQSVEPLYPPGLTQPTLNLPFLPGQLWSFTGGPHGAWEHEGARAALDFAPASMQAGCIKSYAWTVAAAPGLIVRSGNGVVVLDLDGDGREQTGWDILYLHLSSDGRAPLGTWIEADDLLGHPSCEGGAATGTHVHIARKYNGEWIPADGPIPFNLGGWTAHAGAKEYEGTLTRESETVTSSIYGSFESRIIRENPGKP